jgi:hypothetical protein
VAIDGEGLVVDDGEDLGDGVFVCGGEFVLGGFAVVDADDDAVGGVGEVAGDGVVCGGVVYELGDVCWWDVSLSGSIASILTNPPPCARMTRGSLV